MMYTLFMDMKTLLQTGESLIAKDWVIEKDKKKKNYKIEFPANSIFDWSEQVYKHISKRFGLYSEEYQKLFRIDAKTSHKPYFRLLNRMATWPEQTRFETKRLVEMRRQLLKQRTKIYIVEILTYLKTINKGANEKKSIYNFDNILDATFQILKIKFLTNDIKSKACGNLLSQALTKKLWNLCKAQGIKYRTQDDEIDKLAQLIQNKTKNKKQKIHFQKSYTRYARAQKVRNQSCHAYEKAASLTDIKSLSELYTDLCKIK